LWITVILLTRLWILSCCLLWVTVILLRSSGYNHVTCCGSLFYYWQDCGYNYVACCGSLLYTLSHVDHCIHTLACCMLCHMLSCLLTSCGYDIISLRLKHRRKFLRRISSLRKYNINNYMFILLPRCSHHDMFRTVCISCWEQITMYMSLSHR